MASDGGGRRRIYIDGEPSAPLRRSPAIPPTVSSPIQPPVPLKPASNADTGTAATLETELRDRLSRLRRDSRRIAESIATHGDEDQRRHEADVAAQQRQVAERKDAALTAMRDSFEQRRRTATDVLAEAAKVVAPGAASVAWADVVPGKPARPATHVRFGLTEAGIPAVAPFLEHSGWALHADDEASVDLIRQVVLRTIAQVPLRFLRIRVFDPRVEGALGWFSELRDANPASYPSPAHSSEDLRAALAELTGLASAAAEQINARHVRTLGELWLDEGRPTHPYMLLVVLAYPLGLDEATQAALVRLADSGSSRGVSLLVQVDGSGRPQRDVHPDDLLRYLTPFESGDGRWRTPLLPEEVAVAADPPPTREVVKAILSRAVKEVSSDTGPTVPLAELLAGFANDPWQDVVDNGIEAVIGLRGREPVTLALRSENPPHPNLLIGGAVGQGKSNLLLTIIYSLAARYGPDQLEMLLLDFKQGLEFKRFDKDDDGRNWLPHARVLSLESSKPFGLAVLEFVQDELERRAQLFNAARCNGFGEYRRTTGQPMTRMLLIIDEFQVLFDGNDDVTAAAVLLFERLARQGRAFGIHILLSSQTLSGISGLQVKGDSIFAQFPLRVSLKNTADESQAILSRGNTAAAELTYRGEVVVNRNYGTAASNEIAVAGYADPAWINELQKTLWDRAATPREPWVFLGNDFAQWPSQLPAADVPTACIGRPIAVTDEIVRIPFADDVDQAVALVGTGDLEAMAVLGACVATVTAGWSSGTRLIVLDGRPGVDGEDSLLGSALDRARLDGIEVQVVRGDEVPRLLMGDLVRGMRDGRPPTLVLAVHLQRIASMAAEVPVDPDNEYGATMSGASALRDLSMHGSTSGIHVIGWWPSLRGLSSHLSFDHGGISRYVFLRAGIEDLRQVAGPHAQPADGSPRVQLFDRGSDQGIRVVVPFEPRAGGVS
ncbi:FtsK/SpoIIIE domain-containing protein [Mycolicibacterium tusciae]|uniref:FtsK/SpoIIIE domain-containing protein n=1 Tax=Mycolicibacterium tusciae TaxID=75922 RepID=UPI00024A325C|nr:FtsK/SpoIIIE domain-containing protein [Mycolicibacterium tusciae]